MNRLPTSCMVYQFDPSHPLGWRRLPFEGSLDEISRRLPQGAYTTFRTYNHTKVLRLPEHFNRLSNAAKALKIEVELDLVRLRIALRRLVAQITWQEQKVRLTLDLTETPGDIYVGLEPLTIPSASDYAEGVAVITRPFHRINPQSKLTAFIYASQSLRENVSATINEVIMMNEDTQLLEGLSSNFFGVSNGAVWTAGECVLPGITRGIVLDALGKIHVQVHFSALRSSQIDELSEAFITSTSRSVLPVRDIDGIRVGTTVPGPVTWQLMRAYQEQILAELVEI